MQKPWIAVQLPASAAGSPTDELPTIERSLSRARELAGADAVILQPSADAARTVRLVSGARRVGLEVLLWFPVLADSPGAPAAPGALTRNSDGSRGHGRSGAWAGLAGGEESFLFHCPNDARYLSSVRAALESLLDSLEVDGVMLDKIRFPSPSNGLEALLCCFCESCAASFEKTTGRPLEEARQRSEAFLGLLRSRGPSVLHLGWAEPGSFWKAAGLEDLAAFRARSVTDAVRALAAPVKGRSLGLGLDLFSPSLAPLVGQDYEALGSLCDWVKPMTYRAAAGPAGLPLEIACLWKALRDLHPPGGGEAARGLLQRVFPWALPGCEARLLAEGFPASVISSELASLRGIPPARTAKVFAGIESVQIPAFGIYVGPRELEANLQAADGLADGIIVSWDLRCVPDENLRLIGSVMPS